MSAIERVFDQVFNPGSNGIYSLDTVFDPGSSGDTGFDRGFYPVSVNTLVLTQCFTRCILNVY